MQLRAPVAPRVAGRRVAVRRVAVSRKTLTVQAAKKSVGDLSKAELEGKRVFVRADLNVPLDKELNITDDTRIRAAVPTLKYLLDNGAKVLLTSHLVSLAAATGRGSAPRRPPPAAIGAPEHLLPPWRRAGRSLGAPRPAAPLRS